MATFEYEGIPSPKMWSLQWLPLRCERFAICNAFFIRFYQIRIVIRLVVTVTWLIDTQAPKTFIGVYQLTCDLLTFHAWRTLVRSSKTMPTTPAFSSPKKAPFQVVQSAHRISFQVKTTHGRTKKSQDLRLQLDLIIYNSTVTACEKSIPTQW